MALQASSSVASESSIIPAVQVEAVGDSPARTATNNSTNKAEGGKQHLYLNNNSSPTSIFQSIGSGGNNSTNANLIKNQYTTEIVKSLFGPVVGQIQYHCPCHHPSRHLSGKLYIGTHALAFYSNLFGIERKVLLDYSSVSAVQEYRTTSIVVFFAGGEQQQQQQEFKFRALPNRCEVLILLKQLIYNATGRDCVMLILADATQDSQPERKSTDSSTEIRNSNNNNKQGGTTARNKLRGSKITPQDNMTPSLRRTRINSADFVPPSFALAKPFHNRQRSLSTGSLRKLINDEPQRQSLTLSRVESNDGDSLAGEVVGYFGFSSQDHPTECDDESFVISSSTYHPKRPLSAMDFRNNNKENLTLFYSMKNEAEEKFKELSLQNHCVSNCCKLETFFDMFIADNASHSVGYYQEQFIGDSEVVTTPWAKSVDSENKIERFLTFRHKVDAPIGPSSTRATKHQTCYMFGSCAFIVDTRTTLKDVHNSDCFHVEDRVIVEQHDNDGSIQMTARFQVRFVKNTMWKKLIERMTRTEVDAWFQGYARMINSAMNGSPVSITDSTSSTNANTIPTQELERLSHYGVDNAVLPQRSTDNNIINDKNKEVHPNLSTAIKNHTIWEYTIGFATSESKGLSKGQHILLLLVCLFVAKLMIDIRFMRESLIAMHRDLTENQLTHGKEIASLYEVVASLKSQLKGASCLQFS